MNLYSPTRNITSNQGHKVDTVHKSAFKFGHEFGTLSCSVSAK